MVTAAATRPRLAVGTNERRALTELLLGLGLGLGPAG